MIGATVTVTSVAVLRRTRSNHTAAPVRAHLVFRVCTGAGVTAPTGLSIWALATGVEPDERILPATSLHVLDALLAMLSIAAIALIIAVVIFFPPIALVATAGGVVLVPTITTGFITLAGAGRPHAGTPVTLIIEDLDIRVINTQTGELLQHLTLNPERDYEPQAQRRKDPNP